MSTSKNTILAPVQDTAEATQAFIDVFTDDLEGIETEVKGNLIFAAGYRFMFTGTIYEQRITKTGRQINVKVYLFNRNDQHERLLPPEGWANEIIKEALQIAFPKAA